MYVPIGWFPDSKCHSWWMIGYQYLEKHQVPCKVESEVGLAAVREMVKVEGRRALAPGNPNVTEVSKSWCLDLFRDIFLHLVRMFQYKYVCM